MIDAHTHVFRPAVVSRRGVDDLAPAERDAPVERLTATMDAHGVSHAVLVPLDEHDAYVREVVAAAPGRFAACAVSTAFERGQGPGDPAAALARRHATFPFRALRTMWLGERGVDVRDAPILPMLRWCAENGVVLWAYLPPAQFPLLAPIAAAVPDLTIALNHFGFSPQRMRVDADARPWFADRLPASRVADVVALATNPRIHVLLSGHYALSSDEPAYRDLHEPTQRYLDAFGADRLLWGSDFPWPDPVPGYGALVDAIDAALVTAGASPHERDLVTGGTARRLFELT